MSTFEIEYEQVVEALDVAYLDIEDVNIRDNYSGRGMYGDTCFGIDFDSPRDMAKFVIAWAYSAGERGEELPEWLPEFREDSMGRGIIVYWERVALTGKPDDED